MSTGLILESGTMSTRAPASIFALIPCAGTGSRAGAQGPKQYQRLVGKRVIDHTVDAFLGVSGITAVSVVVAPDDTTYRSIHDRVMVWHVGGATRAHSVFAGLRALAGAGAQDSDWVLVHDAARCLVQPADIEALMAACQDDPIGGLLALPLPDTLKQAGRDAEPPRVSTTLDRSDKWLAQTPQMFRWGVLYRAMLQREPSGFAGITDESSAVEAAGQSPRLVPGSARNFKVTYPEDFAIAEALLSAPTSMEPHP